MKARSSELAGMQWEDLRYFLAMATAKSLAAAARDLGVSQATVWRHIGRLERSLGVRLFGQRGAGYAPSPAGEMLLVTARRVAAQIDEAQRELREDAAGLRGEVRLTAPEMVTELLAMNLSQLTGQHPGLRLELIAGSPTAALSRLETDIALRYDESPQADFSIDRSYEVGFGVFASPLYMERHGEPSAIDRFEDHRLVEFDNSVSHVAPLQWLRRGGKGAHVVFRSNSLQARLSAAKAGIGCVLLPCLIGNGVPGLQCVLGPDQAGSLELFVFSNDRVRGNPRVAAVRDYIGDLLSRHADILAGAKIQI